MTKLAYSYLRFSTGEQADGDSERRQTAKFNAYCKTAKLTPGPSFADKGKSGYKAEHLGDTGELRRFLDLAQKGEIPKGSFLVVENLDRLGRQEVEDAFGVFSSILAVGVCIVTLPDGQPPQEFKKGGLDIVKLVMVLMDMSRAHGESQRKQELLGEAFANKQALARANYTPMGRACPLWLKLKPNWRSYDQDGSAYEPIADRAATVNRIFQMSVDGLWRGAIANLLNADGVENFKADWQRSKGKRVSGWGTSSVAKVLANEAVFGRYRPFSVQGTKDGKRVEVDDKNPIENYYPAIVDKELFEQAQGCLEQRRVQGSGTKQSKRYNVWQGISKCVFCGSALHFIDKGKKPKGGQYLHCARARKGMCEGKSVRLDQSESVFSGMLARLDSLSLVTKDTSQTLRQVQVLDGQLVGKRKHLAQLTEYQNDPETASRANARQMAVLEGEIGVLEQDRQKLQQSVAVATVTSMSVDEFQSKVDLLTPDGRHKANTLLRRLCVVVHIGKEEGYAVSQNGRIAFGMAFKDGQAGYLGTVWSKPPEGQELHTTAAKALKSMASIGEFIPANDAGVSAYADQWDAEERAADALEHEGQRLRGN